jgi:hypothetical protein
MTSHIVRTVAACALVAAAAPWLRADQVTLAPSRDNTIYSESLNAAGTFDHIFAGRTSSGFLRRALIGFDVSPVPAGSVVTEVTLHLHLTMTNLFSGPREMALHRLLADWGEGTSVPLAPGGTGGSPTPDSATWQHTFYDTQFWATPGGDFVAVASAETQVDDLGPYEWSSPGLTADVQAWLDAPSTNFGWVLLGDEVAFGTAKRFASREATVAAMRPALVITFTPPASCYADCDGNEVLNVDDFLCFINAFASQDPYADCDGNQTYNVDDFLCFINDFAQGCP